MTDARTFLTTRTLDAEPEGKDEFPGPTIWPFLAAARNHGRIYRQHLHALGYYLSDRSRSPSP